MAMLTGDRAATARAVARRLQIADVEAEPLPADKVTAVERRKRQGQIVAMAGDGINDAPAGITLPRRHRPGADPVDGKPWPTSARTWLLPALTISPACAGRRPALSPSGPYAFTDHRRGGDGIVVGQRDSAMRTRLKRARL